MRALVLHGFPTTITLQSLSADSLRARPCQLSCKHMYFITAEFSPSSLYTEKDFFCGLFFLVLLCIRTYFENMTHLIDKNFPVDI